jgi:starch phosphorylase
MLTQSAAGSDISNRLMRQSPFALRLDVPLIGFARRMTDYKRPTLLFSDTERLLAIGRERPLQV